VHERRVDRGLPGGDHALEPQLDADVTLHLLREPEVEAWGARLSFDAVLAQRGRGHLEHVRARGQRDHELRECAALDVHVERAARARGHVAQREQRARVHVEARLLVRAWRGDRVHRARRVGPAEDVRDRRLDRLAHGGGQLVLADARELDGAGGLEHELTRRQQREHAALTPHVLPLRLARGEQRHGERPGRLARSAAQELELDLHARGAFDRAIDEDREHPIGTAPRDAPVLDGRDVDRDRADVDALGEREIEARGRAARDVPGGVHRRAHDAFVRGDHVHERRARADLRLALRRRELLRQRLGPLERDRVGERHVEDGDLARATTLARDGRARAHAQILARRKDELEARDGHARKVQLGAREAGFVVEGDLDARADRVATMAADGGHEAPLERRDGCVVTVDRHGAERERGGEERDALGRVAREIDGELDVEHDRVVGERAAVDGAARRHRLAIREDAPRELRGASPRHRRDDRGQRRVAGGARGDAGHHRSIGRVGRERGAHEHRGRRRQRHTDRCAVVVAQALDGRAHLELVGARGVGDPRQTTRGRLEHDVHAIGCRALDRHAGWQEDGLGARRRGAHGDARGHRGDEPAFVLDDLHGGRGHAERGTRARGLSAARERLPGGERQLHDALVVVGAHAARAEDRERGEQRHADAAIHHGGRAGRRPSRLHRILLGRSAVAA
jgi:hypothetical protein